MFLTVDNFNLFAAQGYDNPNCTDSEEFEEDLARIKYIKRLIKKFKGSGVLKCRLILNHLIILYNVFEKNHCTTMLLYSLKEYLQEIKPFLIYLGHWPTSYKITLKTNPTMWFLNDEIAVNQQIVQELRKI